MGGERAPVQAPPAALDVAALFGNLLERDRLILWLVVAQGLKPREAAPALGCQPDSVRKLTQRALDRARRGLPARER